MASRDGGLQRVGAVGAAERLGALERDTPGALGSPLLVPYLGAAIAAVRDGEAPGESQRLPSIADTFSAHAAAMSMLVADARGRESLHR